ncbi:MAG: patatin-like phospholipase family protein [Verrucomicrobia bacterium]|nr:patatin-like phospholipase family protein [Verrucomicrobiota bacterium]MBV8279328.1 patatin-like phospholipase family protein [Verrucomicrobiota bacterium]
MSYYDKLLPKRRHRLLACDGGGIRGLISIEVLAKVEKELRSLTGKPALVLADFFDYVGGTSCGAIIAALIAMGKPMDEIRAFFVSSCPDMFLKARLWERWHSKFRNDALSARLRELFGHVTLGSDRLQTLLMLVLSNASTNSPWPVCNNPAAKYNDRQLPDCNLKLPLWQLVRASTAAPTYFPPELIHVGTRPFVFVDGAMTMYHNPAFQLFLMATTDVYRLGWEVGVDRLLLISVGSGNSTGTEANLSPQEMNILYNASRVPTALLAAAQQEQDFLCRIFGETLEGEPLDSEIGDMRGHGIRGSQKLFSYVRYNAELSRAGLDWLGLPNVNPAHVHPMDAVEFLDDVQQIGIALGERKVKPEHFAMFVPEELTRE